MLFFYFVTFYLKDNSASAQFKVIVVASAVVEVYMGNSMKLPIM